MVNILPVCKLGVSLLDCDVLAPFFHSVNNTLVNYRLKFPGEEYLASSGSFQLGPVLWKEIVGAAATPVHYMFVLTLTALLPLPIGQVKIVVYVGHAIVRVAENCVEERLCRQQGVTEYFL